MIIYDVAENMFEIGMLGVTYSRLQRLLHHVGSLYFLYMPKMISWKISRLSLLIYLCIQSCESWTRILLLLDDDRRNVLGKDRTFRTRKQRSNGKLLSELIVSTKSHQKKHKGHTYMMNGFWAVPEERVSTKSFVLPESPSQCLNLL